MKDLKTVVFLLQEGQVCCLKKSLIWCWITINRLFRNVRDEHHHSIDWNLLLEVHRNTLQYLNLLRNSLKNNLKNFSFRNYYNFKLSCIIWRKIWWCSKIIFNKLLINLRSNLLRKKINKDQKKKLDLSKVNLSVFWNLRFKDWKQLFKK